MQPFDHTQQTEQTLPTPPAGYISAVDAGARFGLTNDHIASLCRKQKVECLLAGRSWYVSPASLEIYLRNAERERQSRQSALSEQLKRQYHERASSAQDSAGARAVPAHNKATNFASHEPRVYGLIFAAALFFLGIGYGLGSWDGTASAAARVASLQTGFTSGIASGIAGLAAEQQESADNAAAPSLSALGNVWERIVSYFAPHTYTATTTAADTATFVIYPSSADAYAPPAPTVAGGSDSPARQSASAVFQPVERIAAASVTQEYLAQRLAALSDFLLPKIELAMLSPRGEGARGISFIPPLSDLSGLLAANQGGTGLSTAPSLGQVLLGNSAGGYDLVATSSLGITAGISSLYASTTIGAGTQATGLTVSGGATTTGNAYFGGTISLGGYDPLETLYAEKSVNNSRGVRYTLKNTNSTGQSYAGAILYASGTTVASQFYADGLGTGPLGTPGFYIGNFSNHPVGFFTNNTEKARLTAAGSFGIGTTSPASMLSLAGSSGLFASTTATSTFQGGGINLITAAGNTGCFAVNGVCITGGGASLTGTIGQLAYFSGSNTAVGTSTMYITAAGNVAIGTTSPYAKLTVWGGSSTAGNALEIANSASTSILTVSNAGVFSVGSNGSNVFTVDAASGSTTITNLSIGNLTFDTNAGVVALSNIPVDSNAAAGVIQSQSLNVGDVSVLTAYGESDGNGGVQNLRVGIGTTSPFATLAVVGRVVASYFTATTTAISTFPWLSSTYATTTSQYITGLATAAGAFLAVDPYGKVIATTTPSGGSSFSYLFPSAATTTGLGIFASTTVGNGTQAGGLTVSGGATTTGNSYFAGNVGIGTTSPLAQLTVATPNGATGALKNLFLVASSTQAGATSTLFVVTNSGNVGVGTTSPYAKLSVQGSAGISGDVGAANITATGTLAVLGSSSFASSLSAGIGSPSATSTWTDRTGAGTRDWRSIAASSDGTKLVAAAYGGDIYTSSDSGANWTDRTGAGARNWTFVVSSSDGTKLAAAASSGYIYTSSDSGANWTEQTNSGQRNWGGLAMSSDGTKLAATVYTGYVYTSSDSGANWTAQTNSGYRTWESITSSADGTKLAAVDFGGNIYTSADSGANWSSHTVSGSGTVWYAITSSSDGAVIVAADNTGYLYLSTDSGANWAAMTGAGAHTWHGLAMSSDGVKIAAAAYGYIYLSGDTGTTWTAQTAAGSRNWHSIAASSDMSTLAGVVVTSGDVYTATASYGGATGLTVSSSGNVGVGSSTPGTLLSLGSFNGINFSTATSTFSATGGINIISGCFAVNGTCLTSGGTANLYASTTIGIGTQAGGLTISGGATTTGNVYVAGNVGIGTTTPYAKLSVAGQGVFNNIWATSTAAINYFGGNVGIGTTSPYARLSVVGETVSTFFTATSTTATSTIAGGLNVGSGALTYDFSSGVTSINNLAIGSFSFDTDAGIVSWADLPISSSASAGTVESYSANVGGLAVLTVYGEADGSGNATNIRVGIGTSSPAYVLDVASTTGAGSVARFTNTTGSCTINPTTTSLSCSSDERLKKNINPLASTSALARILRLDPVYYNWNSEGTSSPQHAGFIAQRVEEIFPDLVSQDDSGYLGVNYGGFAPYLASAIQEIANMGDTFKSALVAWFADAANGITRLFAKEVHTDMLCVGSTCVTQEQFLAMVNASGGGASAPVSPPEEEVPPAADASSTPPVVDDSQASSTPQVADTPPAEDPPDETPPAPEEAQAPEPTPPADVTPPADTPQQ